MGPSTKGNAGVSVPQLITMKVNFNTIAPNKSRLQER